MRQAGNTRGARTGRVLFATATALSLVPLAARAETVAGVDVSVGGLAASNPYFLPGSDTESGAVSLSLRPYISYTEDATTVILDGTLDLEHFFDHYGTDESAQVAGSLVHRLNERTTVTAGVGYMSSESAARHFYGGADLTGLQPGEFPDSSVVDPTLGNLSGRTSLLNFNLGLEQQVSTRGTINLNSRIGFTEVEVGTVGDYRDTSSSVSYTQQIDERTSWVVSLHAGYADYAERRAGDGLFTNALVGVDHKFTESMYGSFQVGFSYAAVNVLLGDREEVTNWAASLDLCDMLARGTVCVTGSRAAQPTSLGGVTMVNSVGLSYARAVGRAGNVSLGASYSKSGMSSSPTFLGRRESEVAFLSATYSHQVAERLSAFITPSFASRDDEFAAKQENYQALLGVTYHFGKTQ